MKEFFFYKTGRKRSVSEIMHDMLMTAKDGIRRTPLMYGANVSWERMHALLKSAEAAGLIEKFEIQPSYWRKKPTHGWKTTQKGLEYARGVYENHKLLQEVK